MPVARSYPGVYIQEIPSGVRTITGVATSITAFIGRAISGPLNRPVTINSFGDFERIFGGLWVSSTLGYAVRDFFQNGGTQAIVVRLFHPYYPTRADLLHARALGTAMASHISAGTGTLATVVAAEIATQLTAAAAYGPAVVLAVQRLGDIATAAVGVGGATFTTVGTAVTNAIPGLTPDTKTRWSLATLVPDESSAGTDLILEAKYDGTYTMGYTVKVTPVGAEVLPSIIARYGGATTEWANIAIMDPNTSPATTLESYSNVCMLDNERRLDRVLENESQLVRVDPTTTWPTSPNHLKTSTSPTYAKMETVSDGSDLIGTDLTMLGAKGGLNALEDADLINLLCIPPFTAGTSVDATTLAAAAALCERRRAVLLVDGPWTDVTSAVASNPVPVTKNAAIYFPKLRQPNPLRSNMIEDFSAIGAVAGVIARTDANRGVWKAPAGLDASLSGVPQLSLNLNDQESGQLNQKGINALRSMPAAGRVVWGSRSRVGADGLASEWKYLPVRRTALYIEESLYRGTQWAVFQPNDEPLWSQLRLSVGNFMQDLFRKGAFQGQQPKDAYFVRCDGSTTTQSDINQGVVNIIVGFAPLKPAEFVIISLQQMAGQSVT